MKPTESALQAIAESLTPDERILAAVTPIALLANAVVEAATAGKAHPAGMFEANGSVLTMSGQPTGYRLAAIAVPAEFIDELVAAFLDARDGDAGQRLRAKILALRPAANAEPT